MDKRFLILVSLFITTSSFAGPNVIYGEDNRVDAYASKDSALVELSRSTAAMIPSSNIKKNFWTGEVEIKAKTLKEIGVCAKERFANQPTAANCSAFLVSDKHLVTAGHCAKNAKCTTDSFVFDYKMENESQINLKPEAANIYKCKKVVSHALDNGTKNDFALIELDRPVTGRRPLEFRKSGAITKGTKLAVIGYPTGLPVKIADGASVRSVNSVYFVADLDTFGGNSGSAVFNVDTHEVEGILVRGAQDYVKNGGCNVPNVYSQNGGNGEEVTNITNVKGLLNL